MKGSRKMVAELIAGAALVVKSIESFRTAAKTAKDISALTKDIDGLFTGAHQLKKQEQEAKRTGQSATQIILERENAKNAIAEAQELIIAKYGYNVWQDILKLQREQALAEKHRKARERREAEARREEVEAAATVGASVILGIMVVGIIGFVLWAMK